MTKTYKLIKRRSGRETIIEGTLEELIEYFQYTLEVGASYNKKIKTNPKTIKTFITYLDLALDEKEGIRKTYVELVK
jgi:uncharacterized protein YqgV (UPF0045/DUF77 family)